MDKAKDISTLLVVRDWIHSKYYKHEESLEIRMVLNSIMVDIQYAIDDIMDDMYSDKVGLDD